jgi:hypothetical protein
MKKINSHRVWNYFNSLSDEDIECSICKRRYKNPLISTIKNHFIIKHPEE